MSVELDLVSRDAEPVEKVVPPQPWGSKNVKVFLASNSPRRRELLSLILSEFQLAPKRCVEERYPESIPAEEVPAFLSALKAEAYSDILDDDVLVITADTVVIHDGKILGKPKDAEDAKAMIRSLAGQSHIVVTGVTLSSKGGKKNETFTEVTYVHFHSLSDAEIDAYVNVFRPLDKAGAYGIQEWIGAAAIDRIEGCFYNVMGLPLHRLYTHLKEFFS